MASRFRRTLSAMALPWLVPLSLLPLPVLATGELPPRPLEVPLEVPVGDLGQNDRLPESLRARYRPAAVGAAPALQAGALGYPLGQQPTEQAPFGWRPADSRNAWRMHTGLDLIAPEGTPVFSVLPGSVRLVAVDPSPLLQPIGTGASVAGRAPLPPLP